MPRRGEVVDLDYQVKIKSYENKAISLVFSYRNSQ